EVVGRYADNFQCRRYQFDQAVLSSCFLVYKTILDQLLDEGLVAVLHLEREGLDYSDRHVSVCQSLDICDLGQSDFCCLFQYLGIDEVNVLLVSEGFQQYLVDHLGRDRAGGIELVPAYTDPSQIRVSLQISKDPLPARINLGGIVKVFLTGECLRFLFLAYEPQVEDSCLEPLSIFCKVLISYTG